MGEFKVAESTICVIGPKRRQNELMTSFLERVTDANCITGDDDYLIPLDNEENQSRLILWDCQEGEEERLFEFESKYENVSDRDFVLFINLSSGLGIEEDAIELGVRGFFYDSDPLERLPKCLEATLNGELWIPRKILANAFLRKRSFLSTSSRKAENSLSKREIEIMNLVMIGATNKDIAAKLFISPHTVKSHVYNIYSKIDVPNRLQAILWAMVNLKT